MNQAPEILLAVKSAEGFAGLTLPETGRHTIYDLRLLIYG